MIHIVLLKFSTHQARAGEFMEAHKSWLQRGFDDGVFLLAGGLEPAGGGAIVAHNLSRAGLESRLAEDPFVKEEVVRVEIFEIEPGRTDERLRFLLN